VGESSPAARSTPSLHVDVRGVGPDLVLLHGWGFDSRVWGPFADALAPCFRLHAVDLPGHGRSHGTPFVDLHDAAARIADRVPVGATVCGWSLGGMLAMHLACRRSDIARKLVLIATTPRFARADTWPSGVPRPTLDDFRAAVAIDGPSTRRSFAARVAHGSPDALAQASTLTTLCDSGAPLDWTSLSRALESLHAADLRDDVARIDAPTLVIHGRRDAVIRVAAGEWLASRCGRDGGGAPAGLRLLEQSGHAPFLDQPQALAQALIDWHG